MNYQDCNQLQSIYMLINLINGKIYIGKANNLKRRIQSHLWSCSKKQIIHHAIKKYGKENFTILSLQDYNKRVDNIELLALEAAYIEFFNATNPKVGYNICLFSNDTTGTVHSKKTKDKMSLNRKGKRCGKSHPLFGKHHTKETKILISKALLGNKKPIGFAQGNKNSNFGKYGANNPNRKSVQQIDKNTKEIIKTWPSIIDACKALHLDSSGIIRTCNGRFKSSGGFQWKYL